MPEITNQNVGKFFNFKLTLNEGPFLEPTDELPLFHSQSWKRFFSILLRDKIWEWPENEGTEESHPRVLFKALILLVKDYTQLYVHTRQINPNPTLINPTQPIRLEL